MAFVLGGRIFTLTPLSPMLDEAFMQLHASFLAGATYSLSQFQAAAEAFFGQVGVGPRQHDAFFNNFTILWRHWLDAGQLERSEEIWRLALASALSWEARHPDQPIHKGTPFYFWGMTAILKGDLDRGYALMHQAVQEDVRTADHDLRDLPAFALATLNSQKVDQAFRAWVLTKADFLEKLMTQYRQQHRRSIKLDELQNRFLQHPSNRDIAFLLSYTVARFVRLDDMQQYALQNDFVSQLLLNLLFDVTLVIDAAIKQHNRGKSKFIDHASFLSVKAGLSVSRDHFAEMNAAFHDDFPGTLAKLLNNHYKHKDGTQPWGLGRDFAIAYGIRNHAAHNVSSAQLVWQQFAEIRQSVFSALFIAVETLY